MYSWDVHKVCAAQSDVENAVENRHGTDDVSRTVRPNHVRDGKCNPICVDSMSYIEITHKINLKSSGFRCE